MLVPWILTLAGLAASQSPDPPAGPGLVELRGSWSYTATRDVPAFEVHVPLPLAYREQAPLTFELSVEPAESLSGATLREDQPGNWIAVLEVSDLTSGAVVQFDWESVVLAAPRSFADLPKKARIPKEWPKEARPWLASTHYVQADAPEIVAVAAEIRGKSRDVLEILDATLERARVIRAGAEGRCKELGAVEALKRQGSCTSCANLFAALLRANDIPARILAGYPTWSGPLQTHYIVEAWVPRYGWYPIESTLLQAPWNPYQQLQVAILPTEYEGTSAGPRFFAAGGVPYLSLTELPDSLGGLRHRGTLDAEKNCDHGARMLRRLTAKDRAWSQAVELAHKRWATWIASKPASTQGRLATELGATEVVADKLTAVVRALR